MSRRFQFSLRWLLVVTTLLSVAIGGGINMLSSPAERMIFWMAIAGSAGGAALGLVFGQQSRHSLLLGIALGLLPVMGTIGLVGLWAPSFPMLCFLALSAVYCFGVFAGWKEGG
jgi:hypothetical protein